MGVVLVLAAAGAFIWLQLRHPSSATTGPPTAFADLLTSQQRAQFLDGLNKKGANQGGYPLSTRRWVMSFAPGSTRLIGSVVKVQGTMSAKSVSDSGTAALAITVNYLFTYAMEPPGVPTD